MRNFSKLISFITVKRNTIRENNLRSAIFTIIALIALQSYQPSRFQKEKGMVDDSKAHAIPAHSIEKYPDLSRLAEKVVSDRLPNTVMPVLACWFWS